MEQIPTLAEEIRQRRRAVGLTQEDLAQSSGISPRAITDLERGVVRTPRRDTVELLAKALGLDQDECRRWQSMRRELSARPAHAGSERPSSGGLPLAPNDLIGREAEVSDLVAMVQRPELRLVSVTGPGGVGKTRVAIEAARMLESAFGDGVQFVDLAPLRDARLVLSAVAEHLGLRDIREHDVAGRLAAYLSRREILIVLDNFEHLLPAAADISQLLSLKTRSCFLVTSRARLQIQPEHEFRLASLALPVSGADIPSEDAGQYPGVRLFVERARQVDPDFALTPDNAEHVLTICARLDGLPLAIELAAARTKLLPPQELRQRLVHRLSFLTSGFRDGPDRHRTMRDAIAWSYELLGPDEQRLFRQLSAFVGGWSLEAAESTNPTDLDVLEGLGTLLDDNLIYRTEEPEGEIRFNMLETIREFGRDKLRESGEYDSARSSHATSCLKLAEAAEPHLRGPDPRKWLDRIEADLPNFRSALDWAEHAGSDDQLGPRLASSLSWYWFRLQGDVSEGRRLLARTLAQAPAGTSVRMRALAGLAWLAHMQRDIDAARTHAQESLAISEEIGDDWYAAWSLHLLGRAAYFDNDPPTAYEFGRKSLDLARVVGDEWLIAWVYQLLGIACLIGDHLDSARENLETSLAIWQRLRDQPGTAALHALLGVLTRREGDFRGALDLFQQSLLIYRSLGARWFAANFIAEVVALASRLDEPYRAARLSGFVDEGWNLIGAGPAPFTEVNYQEGREIIRQSLTPEEIQSARDAGKGMTLDEAVEEALLVGRQSGSAILPDQTDDIPVGEQD